MRRKARSRTRSKTIKTRNEELIETTVTSVSFIPVVMRNVMLLAASCHMLKQDAVTVALTAATDCEGDRRDVVAPCFAVGK